MKIDTKVILTYDDMFIAFKEYVAKRMPEVAMHEVCNFRLEYDMDNYTKSFASVQLQIKEAKS